MSGASAVRFLLLDYILFGIVFIIFLAIGGYYAILVRNKVSTIEEYLLGNRKMKLLPVSLSLVATTVAGFNILAHITEFYAYGTHVWIFLLFTVLRLGIVQVFFLPVLYELQIISGFQYFELRFDRNAKRFTSLIYILVGFFMVPLIIYVPSITLQKVTGINLYAIAVIIMSICVCYTAIGGIKAVVWTDIFQLALTIASVIIIMCVGLYSVGGFENVWKALNRGGRLEFFKTDFDLEARGTVWAYMFSIMFISIYNNGVAPSSLQRYNSLPSLKKAKYSLWISAFITITIVVIQLVIGSLIYTTYETCDPLSSGQILKIDQILPFFVQDRASLFPGFSGIFIASIFSAGVSMTSTYLNTMSGTIYNDFLAKKFKSVHERTAASIIKGIVVLIGILGIIFLFFIERMGTVFKISMLLNGFLTVTVFGLFILGIFFPYTNSKGAKSGLVVSIIVMAVLTIGNYICMKDDAILPMRTEGCPKNETFSNKFPNKYTIADETVNNTSLNESESIPWIFRINYQYHVFIGIVINFWVAWVVSALSGGGRVRDQRLLATFLRKEIHQDPLLRRVEPTTTELT